MKKHEQFIHRCLELASLGRGQVGNGAMVGAVLVKDGKVVAEGWHAKFGAFHAELDLLTRLKINVESSEILYVNLEPCCHHGKTSPCTDIILESGVKTVVYGMDDPDPRVAGKGIELLRRKGVNVIGPIARAECEYFNRGFVSVRTKVRPWITLKMARTKAGEISNKDGYPLKITSEIQDRWSHAYLRGEMDAILVGVETVVRDNPQLNTRFAQSSSQELGIPVLWRIILDPQLRVPLKAHVVSDNRKERTIIIMAEEGSKDVRSKQRELEAKGVRVVQVPLGNGCFVWTDLWRSLTEPKGEFVGITSILVEGGEKTWRTFREAKMVDEEVTLAGAM